MKLDRSLTHYTHEEEKREQGSFHVFLKEKRCARHGYALVVQFSNDHLTLLLSSSSDSFLVKPTSSSSSPQKMTNNCTSDTHGASILVHYHQDQDQDQTVVPVNISGFENSSAVPPPVVEAVMDQKDDKTAALSLLDLSFGRLEDEEIGDTTTTSFPTTTISHPHPDGNANANAYLEPSHPSHHPNHQGQQQQQQQQQQHHHTPWRSTSMMNYREGGSYGDGGISGAGNTSSEYQPLHHAPPHNSLHPSSSSSIDPFGPPPPPLPQGVENTAIMYPSPPNNNIIHHHSVYPSYPTTATVPSPFVHPHHTQQQQQQQPTLLVPSLPQGHHGNNTMINQTKQNITTNTTGVKRPAPTVGPNTGNRKAPKRSKLAMVPQDSSTNNNKGSLVSSSSWLPSQTADPVCTTASPTTTTPFPPLDSRDDAPPSVKDPPDFWYWLPSNEKIGDWDVLCGRGGESNNFIGNKKYRSIVNQRKDEYRGIPLKQRKIKTAFVRSIVQHINNCGGRFVDMEETSSRYYVVTMERARKKTSQALRETKELKWLQLDNNNNNVETEDVPIIPITNNNHRNDNNDVGDTFHVNSTTTTNNNSPKRQREKMSTTSNLNSRKYDSKTNNSSTTSSKSSSVCSFCGKMGHKTKIAKACLRHSEWLEENNCHDKYHNNNNNSVKGIYGAEQVR